VAVDLHGARCERRGERECAESRGEQPEVEHEIAEEMREIGREIGAPDVHAEEQQRANREEALL
jgi:hypothetical protein